MRIRAQRTKVELEEGGKDRKWVRSHSTITRTITNTIINAITICFQLRSQRLEERLARFVQHKLLQFLHHENSELFKILKWTKRIEDQ